jgi:hypothetical protein
MINTMKKQILLIVFMCVAVAGFSQISKADAAGFLTRNLAGATGVTIYNTISGTAGTRGSNAFNKADIVSLTAMDSGFSLIAKQESVNREKFFPYAGILYINVSSDGVLNIFLHD